MPCPPDKPINGQGRITTYALTRRAAEAQAVAAVPGAAMLDAQKATDCPGDCRFASPYRVRYKISRVDSTFSLLNIFPTFGLFMLFGQGGIYHGVAEYDWWATARCVASREAVFHSVATEYVPG